VSEDEDALAVYYKMKIGVALKKGIIPHSNLQLKPFEETDCLKSITFINSNNLSIKNISFVSN